MYLQAYMRYVISAIICTHCGYLYVRWFSGDIRPFVACFALFGILWSNCEEVFKSYAFALFIVNIMVNRAYRTSRRDQTLENIKPCEKWSRKKFKVKFLMLNPLQHIKSSLLRCANAPRQLSSYWNKESTFPVDKAESAKGGDLRPPTRRPMKKKKWFSSSKCGLSVIKWVTADSAVSADQMPIFPEP